MIVIKNSQLSNEVIQVLNSLLDMNIKASAAFKLMRIIKELSSIVEDKLKAEKKIINKWIEFDSNGNPVPVFDSNNNIIEGAVKVINIPSFEQEMKELLDMENTLVSTKVNFDSMGLEDSLKIKDLLKIEFIFE